MANFFQSARLFSQCKLSIKRFAKTPYILKNHWNIGTYIYSITNTIIIDNKNNNLQNQKSQNLVPVGWNKTGTTGTKKLEHAWNKNTSS